jgi:hypothetical protein
LVVLSFLGLIWRVLALFWVIHDYPNSSSLGSAHNGEQGDDDPRSLFDYSQSD